MDNNSFSQDSEDAKSRQRGHRGKKKGAGPTYPNASGASTNDNSTSPGIESDSAETDSMLSNARSASNTVETGHLNRIAELEGTIETLKSANLDRDKEIAKNRAEIERNEEYLSKQRELLLQLREHHANLASLRAILEHMANERGPEME